MMERMRLVRRSIGTALTTASVAVIGSGLVLSSLAAPASAVAPAADPTASASPSASASASASPSPTASASPTATPSASASASATASATASPTASPTASASASASPAASPAATPVPSATTTAVPLPRELGSWCRALIPPRSTATEKKAAWALMGGKATMSQGGTYLLAEHPNWRPQAGTDTSGDRHVHSLNWALPLLYRGVQVQSQPMIDRFRSLITYWINDHQGRRGYWVDGSIYGGLRTQTLLCAAQTLGDPLIANAALRDARTMIGSRNSQGRAAIGANNTDLIRQVAALGVFCSIGDIPNRDRAWGNVLGVTRGLIQEDGSDVEGSPGYAMYAENILQDVERAANTCGISAREITEIKGRLYDFVSTATRPDYRLESLGDTINARVAKSFAVGDPRAEWLRSGGAQGAPPSMLYSYYDGGYVFARAGWNPPAGAPDTFYSVRYSSTRPKTPHAHDDGAGLTLFSRGVGWIADPGPYRYENGSSLRIFLRSRNAHSSVTVSNVERTKARKVTKVVTTSDWPKGGNDNTCVRDNTWSNVIVTRCITYVRSIDAVIVADYVNAGKGGKRSRVVTQRWQLPPGIGAEQVNGGLALTKDDKRLEVVKAGTGGWSVKTAKSGSSVGWHTGAWGERLPGAVLMRELRLPRAASTHTQVTVFVPRSAAEATPVTINGDSVTITRGGATITTPLPRP